MRAYYYDNLPGDQRLPHECTRPVSTEAVIEALNIKLWNVPHVDKIDAIAAERGYKNREVTDISKEGLGDAFEAKVESYLHEHMHDEEEARYVVSGSGFVDVRETSTETLIRLAIEAGDLFVLPAGMTHRFTLDQGNAMVSMMLSQGIIPKDSVGH